MTTFDTTFQVILRRQDGSVEFTREWEDFKQGFGSLTGEFYTGQSFHWRSSSAYCCICVLELFITKLILYFAGHEVIHQLTSSGRRYSLRVDLESYEGERIFAEYSEFSIGSESSNYILNVAGFINTSTAGKSRVTLKEFTYLK